MWKQKKNIGVASGGHGSIQALGEPLADQILKRVEYMTSRRFFRLSRKLFGSAIAIRGTTSQRVLRSDSRNFTHLLLVASPVAVQVRRLL